MVRYAHPHDDPYGRRPPPHAVVDYADYHGEEEGYYYDDHGAPYDYRRGSARPPPPPYRTRHSTPPPLAPRRVPSYNSRHSAREQGSEIDDALKALSDAKDQMERLSISGGGSVSGSYTEERGPDHRIHRHRSRRNEEDLEGEEEEYDEDYAQEDEAYYGESNRGHHTSRARREGPPPSPVFRGRFYEDRGYSTPRSAPRTPVPRGAPARTRLSRTPPPRTPVSKTRSSARRSFDTDSRDSGAEERLRNSIASLKGALKAEEAFKGEGSTSWRRSKKKKGRSEEGSPGYKAWKAEQEKKKEKEEAPPRDSEDEEAAKETASPPVKASPAKPKLPTDAAAMKKALSKVKVQDSKADETAAEEKTASTETREPSEENGVTAEQVNEAAAFIRTLAEGYKKERESKEEEAAKAAAAAAEAAAEAEAQLSLSRSISLCGSGTTDFHDDEKESMPVKKEIKTEDRYSSPVSESAELPQVPVAHSTVSEKTEASTMPVAHSAVRERMEASMVPVALSTVSDKTEQAPVPLTQVTAGDRQPDAALPKAAEKALAQAKEAIKKEGVVARREEYIEESRSRFWCGSGYNVGEDIKQSKGAPVATAQQPSEFDTETERLAWLVEEAKNDLLQAFSK